MKILVTGAGGFLGRAVVQFAAAKHQVVALVRPAADVSGHGWPDSVQIVRGDLREPGQWCALMHGIEAIVHLAAATSGDLSHQFRGTVVATENFLGHIPLGSINRFVHVSSFSVYDFGAIPTDGLITETTPIEPRPERRDAYTITKIHQERLVVEACQATHTPYVILRPGVVYGPGKNWDYGRAICLGRFDIIFSPGAAFRLTFVDNCAEAIVKSLDAPVPSGSIFNIVDDELPSHRRYYYLCRRAGASTGWPIYVPWFMITGLGRIIALVNRIAFRGGARLPEILAHPRQQARWKPLHYTNEHAKAALGWSPRIRLEDALTRTVTGKAD